MIKLTNENGNSFYLNESLIEIIVQSHYANTSEIRLTTGRWVSCRESNETVNYLIEEQDKEIKN